MLLIKIYNFLLLGTKTYTVFAPTDSAFSALTDAELDKLLTRREAARTIVLRHIMPGTLYSAGMQYYQVKESMERGQKITLQKELGMEKFYKFLIKSPDIILSRRSALLLHSDSF